MSNRRHRLPDSQSHSYFVYETVSLCALLFAIAPAPLGAQETRKSYPRDLITQEEIRNRAVGARTAYDVITRLRPNFLKERSSGSIPKNPSNPAASRQPIQVYVNGVRSIVGVADLRDIIAENVVDILYLNASDATTRFGIGHNNGAILVRSR